MIEIIDINGHYIKKQEINSTNSQVVKTDMSDFKNGVYFLNIYQKEKKIITQKILVTK
ncbi:MAG: T9SS type A sorting domain-containing protein [Chlorobi bacterium]|nr:T9SS type A sorting domain-containing protein [Chlorobiota bacterium]